MAKRPFFPADAEVPEGSADASRTLIEQTYAALRADIVEGRLAPGEKLRVEHLRKDYQVSAGTLREAITRLASDALVTTEGQRGFRVTPITLEELEDLTRLRVQIEIEALRQSIRHGGAAWRTALRQSYEALSAVEQPIQAAQRRQWEVLNMRFHEALLHGHPSPWTHRILRMLSRHSERYRRYAMGLPGQVRDVHAEHTAIFERAMDGHEARAALALEAHIRTTPDLLAQALRSGRLSLPGPPASLETAGGPPDPLSASTSIVASPGT
ncbi:MAG: GntR family transcriptional regulator [Burkholderiaceae bacterium]|nr:GntR family transcriptional regulator [Burkholderiaceae bacterium]